MMDANRCTFGPPGGMPQSLAANFKSLPPRQILTLNFDAPEMWLVEPVVAEHDLDNIKLEQLGDSPTLSAVYELEALMLTGRCIDPHSRRRDLVSPASLSVCVCLPGFLTSCWHACLLLCLPACLPLVCMSLSVTVCLSVRLSVCIFFRLSVRLSEPSVSMPACMSACL